LVAEFPTRPGLRLEQASAYRELASKVYADQPTLAQTNLNRALDVLQRLVADYPGIPVYEEQLARVHMSLADVYWQLGQNQQAEEASRTASSGFEQLAVRFPGSPHYRERLVEYDRDLLPRLLAAGRSEDARRVCQRIIANLTLLAGEFDAVPRYHEQLASFLVNCPIVELRDTPFAVKAGERAVALRPKSSESWETLGAALYRAGRWGDAVEALGKSVDLAPRPRRTNQIYLAMAHWQLADQLSEELALNDAARARQTPGWHRKQATEIYEQALEWLSANRPDGEGTSPLQAEAAELLGVRSDGHSASNIPPSQDRGNLP
jgi:tetratricopeptide (TPR) repeat protein